jgi:hypothetical protein
MAMRLLLTMLLLTLAVSSARAVDHRWTLISDEEYSSATIDNDHDSSISIVCALASKDVWGTPRDWKPRVSVFIAKPLNDGATEDTVQFIVDGRSYPFTRNRAFRYIWPISAEEKRDLREFVTALASSNQQTFVIRFPKYKHSETFSLLDARKVLGNGKDFILDRCENPPQQ